MSDTAPSSQPGQTYQATVLADGRLDRRMPLPEGTHVVVVVIR